MPPEEKNRIEDLKQSLYSRNAPDIRSRRRLRSTDEVTDIRPDWGESAEQQEEEAILKSSQEPSRKHSMSFFTKLFIGSAVFCIMAVGVGAYIFWNGANFISGNNIAIDISGPVSVPGGSPISFAITVTNKNSLALKTADLLIQFPAGTTDPADTTQSLEEHKEVLGDIPPGGSVTKTVSAVIFGEENMQKKVTATVTYGIAGSNSVFTKESSYDVVVSASPVVLTVSSLQEAISGQDFDLTVDVKSNSTNTMKNVIMKATYPFGYTFKSASIKPATSDNSVWSIGDIPPGGERTITIHGNLIGEDTDVKAFHFAIGAKSSSNPTMIGTTFIETQQVLSIKKPFVSLAIGVDNDASTGDHVGSFGRPSNVSIHWANNLPETLSNMVVTAHLSGSAYDKSSVSAWNGFFRSVSDDVVWDQKTNPELASVASGANGTLSFTVTPSESQGSGASIANPMITVSAQASGDRPSSANVPLNTGSIARNIKIAGDISLSGRVIRSGGVFVNSGPIPPVAEQNTTYTIIWSVDHSSNAASDAVVTATLPPYVSWTSQVNPSTEDISYDKNSGVVTWNIGNLDAPTATAGSGTRREAQFQISFQPSVAQVGQAPVLENQANLTATDSWTKTTIQSSQGYLTTSFSTDSSYQSGFDVVANNK